MPQWDVRRDAASVERRRALVPKLAYPADLPVVAHRQELLTALADHQVVVVAGETGSGKSTQLPKLCLELGQGVEAMIGHTQPRRLAARTVAERVAEELGAPVGGAVGYAVRFTDKVSDDTLVKVMTDGLLLAEIRRDRLLRAYDTIIVDEAHERTLTIDFLLGYLTQILPQRPDLKVVITSATIDTTRFAAHFGGAPTVEVSGRGYPVEVRYRPFGEDPEDERDQPQAICDAVAELTAEAPGDVLVFLSGEREIRDTADALAGTELDIDVLPLYARLSLAEQHRVFASHTKRRVVLATNVAETSLTVPGITAVVDAGTARISRYNRRTKVQRLPIEPVSQASARQRAGRCGRTAPGTCIRLYSEESFAARPVFTEPEIRRTNLASVILQMASLGLGNVEDFPFVDPPDRRQVRDGVMLLEELAAVERRSGDDGASHLRLTRLGRRLAQLPVDPRLGRMVIEAERRGCLREVLVVVAGLSIQDPRERPQGKEQAADELHRRFADPDSDFVAILNLWEHLEDRRRHLSSGQMRRLCRAELLNHLRVREWQDVHSQLVQVVRAMGLRRNGPGDLDRHGFHLALASGLLSQIGAHDPERGDYAGARGARFTIGRGSVLARRKARFVIAAELVEVGGRSWARTVARIQPDRLEEVAAHLVVRSRGEPFWDERQGAAVVNERVMLFGLVIVPARRVQLARLDPAQARAMFLQHALVEGDWHARHAFVARNRAVLEEVRRLGDRARRPDLVAGDAVLLDFFDRRVPEHVATAVHFDRWWRDERHLQPDLLTFTPEQVMAGEPVRPEDVPDAWRWREHDLPLSYVFAPGTFDDGVTVDVPLGILRDLAPEPFGWHVPALRPAVVAGLISTLPKALRRRFVPLADIASRITASSGPGDGAVEEVVAAALAGVSGAPLPAGLPDVRLLPDPLRITFRVLSASGREVRRGKDLPELQRALLPEAIAAVAEERPPVEVQGLRSWTIGTLPREVECIIGGRGAIGHPALVDQGDTVDVAVLPTEEAQHDAMVGGTARLLLLGLDALGVVQDQLDGTTGSRLGLWSAGPLDDLLADVAQAAVIALVAEHGGPAWDEAGFARLTRAVSDSLADAVSEVLPLLAAIVEQGSWVATLLDDPPAGADAEELEDLRRQWDRLLGPGFVTRAGRHRLPVLRRALEAMEDRLDSMVAAPARDRQLRRQVQQLEDRYERVRRYDRSGDVAWMLADLRTTLLAPAVALRWRTRVGEQDVRRAIDRLRRPA